MAVTLIPESDLTDELILEVDHWLEDISEERDYPRGRQRVWIAQGDRIFILKDVSAFGGATESPAFFVWPRSFEMEFAEEYGNSLAKGLGRRPKHVFQVTIHNESVWSIVVLRFAYQLAKRINAKTFILHKIFNPPGYLGDVTPEYFLSYLSTLPGICTELKHDIKVKRNAIHSERHTFTNYVLDIQKVEAFLEMHRAYAANRTNLMK